MADIRIHDGMAFDFSDVVAMELVGRYTDEPTQIRIIFKQRPVYVENPETTESVLHFVQDEANFEYPEYEQAVKVLEELTDLWKKTKE